MSARHAWSFLTRLPGGSHPEDGGHLGASVPWFPVVGATVGLMVGLIYVGASELMSATAAATVAVMFGVIITGAFHEDGLADTADSLGGYTPERRLEIMKDSRVGTFGVLALVFSVMIRVVGLGGLEPGDGLVALILAHTIGRSLATLTMVSVAPASGSGLGHDYTRHLPSAAVMAIGVIVAGCALVGGPASTVGYLAALIAAAMVVALARRAFGGTTGDVLGAIEQVGEMAVLTAAARLVGEHGWQWG